MHAFASRTRPMQTLPDSWRAVPPANTGTRRIGRAMLTMAVVAALAYLGLCVLMFAAQRQLLFFPTPATGEPAQRLPRGDGGHILFAERARPGEHAVLYLGGNAEDPTAAVRMLAQAFPDHAVYGLHYRGYAGSAGEPSEVALREDAAAWFAHLQQRHPRITLIGRSLGTAVAVRLAAGQAVERLVLVTPYDSIVAVAAGHYPWLPARWLVRDRFEAWKDAARVHAPTLLLLAEHDSVIPPAHGHALHRHFKPGIAQLHTLAGTDHNSIAAHPDYLRLLQQ
jgi:pimeloyl-ACP methyl ester carboxylesterase